MSRGSCIGEDDGPIPNVTFNRPEGFTAMNDGANDELAEVCDEFATRNTASARAIWKAPWPSLIGASLCGWTAEHRFAVKGNRYGYHV